ncbi:hypothetical protein Angca_000463, partial [Angiostrongylus cantonensis]
NSAVDYIERNSQLIQYLHVSAMKAESSKVTKRRLSPEIVELIRQRGIALVAGNCDLTSKLAKQCRQAMEEILEKRRAAGMAEAAEAGKSIRRASR